LNYRNFNKPFLCKIQSLETWNLRDRDLQNQVSRLHHCKSTQVSRVCFWESVRGKYSRLHWNEKLCWK